MDKTPQIAEEQLAMMIDKAQETKLLGYKKVSVSVFSADISKSEDAWRPIDKALDYVIRFLCN